MPPRHGRTLLCVLACGVVSAASGGNGTAEVLKVPAFAAAFDTGDWHAAWLPTVGILQLPRPRSSKRELRCGASWEDATGLGGKMDEMLQDVGFARCEGGQGEDARFLDQRRHGDRRFFREAYPRTTRVTMADLAAARDWAGVFFYLPFCGWSEGWLAEAQEQGIPMGEGPDRSPALVIAAVKRQRLLVGLRATVAMVERLLLLVPGSRVLFLAAHPMLKVGWKSAMVRLRALRVDATWGGSHSQVMIPQSTKAELCPLELPEEDPDATRPTLVSVVGARRKKAGAFIDVRPAVYEAFQELQSTEGAQDVDAREERDAADYDGSFARAKFCLVTPGDTQSTSQGARAMCAGCVPIFAVPEFEDLPYANVLDYRAFSLRLDTSEVMRTGGVASLYAKLQALVASGEYERLRQGVLVARPFFNYHRFDLKSPYGAAMASMVHDEAIKYD